MDNFKKAESLREVAAQTTLNPLKIGDPRYADLTEGRSLNDLDLLRTHLTDVIDKDGFFTKVAFTGPRGCGKTTELYRLEQDLNTQFESLHLYVDESLTGDCDYTDLLLWLVEQLVKQFEQRNMLLNKDLVNDVVDWFAQKTLEKVEAVKQEITMETEGKAEARASIYWLRLGLLAHLRSMILGNVERRKIIRQELQNYSSNLIDKVNLLLNNAQQILSERYNKKLLIVQDNLDRLRVDSARQLFFTNGDLLRAYTKTNYAIFIYAASANSTGSHNRLSIKRIDAT